MSQSTNREPTRLQHALAGAPGWVGGALAGVQSAVLGLVVVLAPAFAAAAAAPTTNGSAAIDWMTVTKFSVRVWLLAHGVPYVVNGVAFTLVPLGLTIIVAVILAAIARRFCTKSWASWAIATGTYTALVSATQVASTRGQPDLASRTVVTAVITIAIAGPAVAAGIWRAFGAEFGWVPKIAPAIRTGLRLGLATTAAALSAAAVLGGAFTYLGRGRIADAVAALGIDPLGGVALGLAEALYAPNITVWMLGWMSGQGFVAGEGSLYSPGVIAADQLPAFPLFGALPTIAGGSLVWAPLAIVAIAAVIRAALWRRIGTHWSDLYGIGAAVAVVAAAVGLLGAVASGALGPGRLAVMGVEVVPVALTCAALAAAGFALAQGAFMLLARLRGRSGPRLSVVPEPDPEPEEETQPLATVS